MIGREDVDATPPLWPPRVRPCSSNPDRRTRIESRTEIRKESSQLLGAMIMWFAGRDQHVQVHRRECCSMSRKAKSSFSAWLLLPDPVKGCTYSRGEDCDQEQDQDRTSAAHRLPACHRHRPSLRVSPAGCVRARPCEETRGYYGTQLSTCINAARALATRQTSRTLPRPTRAPRPNGRCH
jgi:hypothetical protein